MKPNLVKRLISVDELAAYLGLSTTYIRKLCKNNLIPYVKFEKRTKFDLTEIDKWIEERKVDVGIGKIISNTNQKGGVGKTTTSVNISYELATRGYKVLVIDGDPQSSCSEHLNKSNIQEPTIYTMLKKFLKSENSDSHNNIIKESIVATDDTESGHKNLFIIPGDSGLFDNLRDKLTSNAVKGVKALSTLLNTVRNDFDFIIIDTAPSDLGIFTQMYLTASDYVLIPHMLSQYTVDAMSRLENTIRTVIEYSNPSLEILGSIVTKFESNTAIHNVMLDEISQVFDVFEPFIPKSIVVEEAESARLPLIKYPSSSDLGGKYSEMVTNILNKLKTLGEKIEPMSEVG